jgi:hypothetical protein
MSIENDIYLTICPSCHIEHVVDLSAHEDITEDDIKFCPFCGHDYDIEVNLDDTNFTDEYKLYDE